MVITHINRKGITYTLCKGSTKTGKPRYYFAREPKDEVMEQMPEGYRITESVNGIVSLTKDRPIKVWADELLVAQQVLNRHPHADQYQLNVRPGRIQVCAGQAQYTAVMQFILTDEVTRLYEAERWGEHDGVADWIALDQADTLSALAERLIPTLGTDAFHELGH